MNAVEACVLVCVSLLCSVIYCLVVACSTLTTTTCDRQLRLLTPQTQLQGLGQGSAGPTQSGATSPSSLHVSCVQGEAAGLQRALAACLGQWT